MRIRLLALVCGLLLLGVGAGPAAAGEPLVGQVADQAAESQQTADSDASSAQYHPTNSNISVRVLSPGDGGSVEQTNRSTAAALAANRNETSQDVDQSQVGSEKGSRCCRGGSTALQEAGQFAGNEQSADADADSTQHHPTNSNISVRVLSPGDDGSVEQRNSSTALSAALNRNETTQDIDQSQSGSGGRCCRSDLGSIQAAGQKAFNDQEADSSADSTQYHPSNENASLRFGSRGHGGSVEQTNKSFAASLAANLNTLEQDIDQDQSS
jgi:hypothetical protein